MRPFSFVRQIQFKQYRPVWCVRPVAPECACWVSVYKCVCSSQGESFDKYTRRIRRKTLTLLWRDNTQPAVDRMHKARNEYGGTKSKGSFRFVFSSMCVWICTGHRKWICSHALFAFADTGRIVFGVWELNKRSSSWSRHHPHKFHLNQSSPAHIFITTRRIHLVYCCAGRVMWFLTRTRTESIWPNGYKRFVWKW